MPTTEKYAVAGSWTTVLSTELNSLANNSNAVSSVLGGTGVFDNTQGGVGDGYTLCEIEYSFSFAVAPTANTAVVLYFLKRLSDGSSYSDGSSSVTPVGAYSITLPLRAVTGQQTDVRHAWLPMGVMKFLARNDGTGQALASSGNTVKIRPTTRAGV